MKHAGANHCYKPFALIIEDFDSDGNVLSSVPLTFFGQVVDNAKCDDADDGETIVLDIEKQSAMLEKFVTAPASDGTFEHLNSFYRSRILFEVQFQNGISMDSVTIKFILLLNSWTDSQRNSVDGEH